LIGGHDKVDVFRKLQPILPEHALFTWCLGSVFSDNQNRVKGIFQSAVAGLETPRNLEYETYTTYIPSVLIDKIKGLKPGKALSEDLKIVDSAPEKEGWKVISGQSAEPSRIPGIVDSLAAINIQPLNPFIVCEFDSIKWGDEGASKPIADRWMEILGTPLIPYDFRERQNLVQKAETHIGELLRIHREIAAKKSKSEQQSGGDASEEE
jgi:hypothetical protein